MAATEYGDISPRTAGYAARQLLERGIPHILIERWGQARPLPSKSSKVMKFRRYEAFPYEPNELTEGVTPASRKLTSTDVQVTLKQYGDLTEITDVVADTHEDPVLNEAIDILSEQAARMLETVRYRVIRAGTNVFYANGSSRGAVNEPISRAKQRAVTRALKRQNARKHVKMVASTPAYGTVSLEPAFIALCHTDNESDVRNMSGFKDTADYGSRKPLEGEIGAVEDVRYLSSSLFDSFPDAGGVYNAGSITAVSTSGSNADVYPVIYLARDAFACVPFKGKNAVTPYVHSASKASKSDPLAQRGSAGWKAYHACVILNDNWMARLEVAVTEL